MKKPVVLAVLDGYGFKKENNGNAIENSNSGFIKSLLKSNSYSLLDASGEAVGLPDKQIGNSEVGHLTIGAGRVVYTGLSLINRDVKLKKIDTNPVILTAIKHANKNNGKVHVMGLLSPGGVHSSQDHIFEIVRIIAENKAIPVVHVFGDGRDVAPKSIIPYLEELNKVLKKYNGYLGSIAGRFYAMDRDKRWERTTSAYLNLLGQNTNTFSDVIKYVELQYNKGITDEFIEPARSEDKNLVIQNGDAIIHANFRPDRARQLSHFFCGSTIYDEKPPVKLNNIYYAIMMTYEGITPSAVIYPTVMVQNTLGKVLEKNNLKQLRIAETEKYAHVTFFFDGGEEIDLKNETKILIPSPKVKTYDETPEMSAVGITDKLIEVAKDFDFVVLNFANADMVGHTGVYNQTVKAIDCIDKQIERIAEALNKLGGTLFITADHGNAEEMIDANGNPVTKHTTNPVIFVSTDKNLQLNSKGSLANVAPTILDYMNLTIPKEMDEKSLIKK
ncbi:MAG: 2,3-bisphosphoglycerate-independent phosphoglycerate mutase [Malacoplasma sp.]|nr:2,3-bisphosphoglycerate-independent phosphoglycerate mutase [Malacoplasma sp.]